MIGARTARPAARRRPQRSRGGLIRRRLGRGRRLPRIGPRAVVALVAVLVILVGAFLWLRNSSLVAVQKVQITGVSGPDAGQIRTALRIAARNMTTLDVQIGQLQTAVRPFPVVKGLSVTTQFPHGMRIDVVEQVPVAVISAAGRRTAVSSDGTLLHDVPPTGQLPTIDLRVPPGGTQLTGYALSEVELLAAAPYGVLSRIGTVSDGAGHGLTAALRNGPSIYFGSSQRLGAKWSSAIAVLGNSGSNGAVYVDVTDPNRPAAGGGSDTNTAPTGTAATATTGSSGTG